MANLTMTYTGTLTIIECYKCHIIFAMPRDLDERCHATGQEFYCPLGHDQVYKTTEVAKLRAERDRLKRQRDWAETARKAAADQAQTAEYQRRAAKGQLTKLRKRVSAGVCPVDGCRRHFNNLEDHMTTEHPDYRETAL